MTYRQSIQLQIAALQKVYDNADILRDYCTEDQKSAWNHLRRELPGIWERLQTIDNRSEYAIAHQKIKSDTSINIPQQTS